MGLSEQEREQIRALAQDLPALWQAAGTTAADRQRVIRLLIEEVVVTVRGTSEQVDVRIRWAGGQGTAHELVRPVRRYEQLSNYSLLMKRIEELRKEGRTLAEVAGRLNEEGLRPPKRSQTFNESIIRQLLYGRGAAGQSQRALAQRELLLEHEWLLSELARELGMPPVTLHRWVRVGWVRARKLPTPGGHWALWADAEERERLTRLRTCPRGWSEEDIFAELTKPKARDDT